MQLALKFRNMLPNIVREELDSLVATISGFWTVEHTAEGRHKTITCDALTVGGQSMGAWIQVPYTATDFTALGGAWIVDAVDVAAFKYTLIGKTMILTFTITGTSTGAGTITELQIKIPGGYSAAPGQARTIVELVDGGAQAGYCLTLGSGGSSVIGIQKITGTPFTPNAVNSIGVLGEITLEIM